MTGILISALPAVTTISGTEKIPLSFNGATSVVTPTILAAYFSGVNTAGTVRSVNVGGGTSGLTFTGGPVTSTGTINVGGGALVVAFGGTGVTTSTGSTALVLRDSPSINTANLVTPNLGTPSAGVMTNVTGLPLTTGVTGVLTTGKGGTNTTSASTGTGGIVLSSGPSITSPTFVSPVLGVVTSGNVRSAIGAIAQFVTTTLTGVVTGGTQIPVDDTIPLITEGNEFLSLAITPTTTSSTLLFDITWMGEANISGQFTMALFQGAVTNAMAAWAFSVNTSDMRTLTAAFNTTASTTAAITYSLRAGGNSGGTWTMNGRSSARLFGGASNSSMKITEIKG